MKTVIYSVIVLMLFTSCNRQFNFSLETESSQTTSFTEVPCDGTYQESDFQIDSPANKLLSYIQGESIYSVFALNAINFGSGNAQLTAGK